MQLAKRWKFWKTFSKLKPVSFRYVKSNHPQVLEMVQAWLALEAVPLLLVRVQARAPCLPHAPLDSQLVPRFVRRAMC
jgi:hypothetical protein